MKILLESDMTAQISLFDLIKLPVRSTALAEQQAKAEGMAYAEGAAADKGYDIEEIRRWCRWFCHANESMRMIQVPRVIWSDVAREHFNIKPLASRGNNFMGGLFLRDFVWTGEWYKSKTSGSHGNLVKLWRLKQAGRV